MGKTEKKKFNLKKCITFIYRYEDEKSNKIV